MKKIHSLMLIAGVLLTASTHARVKGRADPDLFSAYPEKSSITKEKNNVRMLVLFSYKHMKSITVYRTGQNETYYYNSTKVLIEFDCEKNRSKIIRTSFFSDNEAKSKVVYLQSSVGDWTPETDRDNPKSLIKAACDTN